MKINTGIILGCVVSAAVTTTASASDILANWTFETSVPTTAGPHIAEAGIFAATSNATGFHANGSVVYSNPAGNGSTESFSSNFWTQGDYYQFTTSTIGYSGISIGWDQTASSTGPTLFDLEWSIDGSTWNTLVDDYTVGTIGWSTGTNQPGSTFAPVSAPAALDNQAIVYFRMTSQVTPANTAGTNRVDNVVIIGNLIPAPGALALLGLAGLVGSRRRRRG